MLLNDRSRSKRSGGIEAASRGPDSSRPERSQVVVLGAGQPGGHCPDVAYGDVSDAAGFQGAPTQPESASRSASAAVLAGSSIAAAQAM